MDACELAGLVRAGELAPSELLAASLARLDLVDGLLNSVVERFEERAEEAAQRWDSTIRDRRRSNETLPPFAGVPFLVKETAELSGTSLTAASRLLAGRRAERDSELQRRYLAAGLVPFGKTNLPEFGILGTTEPEMFGPAHNPWDLERTPGGSSGGSAAAVAAGVVPMAHGSDGGGSIRIPASCCGLVGLKPSRDRTPTAIGLDPARLIGEHVLTRSVADCAAALDATAGPFAGLGRFLPAAAGFADAASRDPAPLRVAYSSRSPLGFPVEAVCAQAAEQAAATCELLGHAVEEAAPELGDDLFDHFDIVWTSQLAAGIDRATGGVAPPPGSVEPLTRAIWERGGAQRVGAYVAALAELQRTATRCAAFHERYDIWLTPTLSAPPPRLGWIDQPPDDPMRAYRRDAELCAFTPLANMTGQPAVSLPLGWSEEGLPVGVQLTAAVGDEMTLLGLAGQLERARPWRRRPPLCG
jgi:amidase